MIIFPAIDIKDGMCVRLLKGDFATVHKVAEDAVETARSFEKAGAGYLHMVDLDGAKNAVRKNRDVFLNVAKNTNLKIEVGGGIRDRQAVDDYLSSGIERVILGSAALRNPALVKEVVKAYPGRIAVGLDAKDGKVSVEGWTDDSNVDYIEFAKRMEGIGVQYLIFTDISTDGTLEGPNFCQLDALSKAVSLSITASGGIRDLSHIRALRERKIYAAICGKSLYSGTLSLKEAIEEAK